MPNPLHVVIFLGFFLVTNIFNHTSIYFYWAEYYSDELIYHIAIAYTISFTIICCWSGRQYCREIKFLEQFFFFLGPIVHVLGDNFMIENGFRSFHWGTIIHCIGILSHYVIAFSAWERIMENSQTAKMVDLVKFGIFFFIGSVFNGQRHKLGDLFYEGHITIKSVDHFIMLFGTPMMMNIVSLILWHICITVKPPEKYYIMPCFAGYALVNPMIILASWNAPILDMNLFFYISGTINYLFNFYAFYSLYRQYELTLPPKESKLKSE